MRELCGKQLIAYPVSILLLSCQQKDSFALGSNVPHDLLPSRHLAVEGTRQLVVYPSCANAI